MDKKFNVVLASITVTNLRGQLGDAGLSLPGGLPSSLPGADRRMAAEDKQHAQHVVCSVRVHMHQCEALGKSRVLHGEVADANRWCRQVAVNKSFLREVRMLDQPAETSLACEYRHPFSLEGR